MKAMKYIERPAELLEAAAKEAGENVEAYYSKHISFMEGRELVAKIESKIDGVYRLSITPKETRNMNTMSEQTTNEVNGNTVTFTDDGNAVTIRVCGKAYSNLSKVASAMNAVSWTDKDNTPSTVLDFWIGELIERTAKTPDDGVSGSIQDVINDIVVGIDTGYDDDTNDDKERRVEMISAFKNVKF